MNLLRNILITGLGTGYLPLAPGTWGSAGACGLFLLTLSLGGADSWIPDGVMVGVVLLGSAGCIGWGGWIQKAFGSKDPSACTLDEWAGQAVALLGIPLGVGWLRHVLAAACAFFAFRAMDILKPPPARQCESLPAGLGVVADDLIAGLYANLLVQIFLRFVMHMA